MYKRMAASTIRSAGKPSLALLLAVSLAGCGLLGGSQVTVRWSTESELDIIGFNLYRAESPDGPFSKINISLIPPADDPFIGAEHTFEDSEVEDGITYYYLLETVNRQGGSSRSGPITITAGS